MSDIMHVWCCTCPYPPSLSPSFPLWVPPSSPPSLHLSRLSILSWRTDWHVNSNKDNDAEDRTRQDMRREEKREDRVEGWDDTLLCGTRVKIRNTTYHHHSQSASSMSFSQQLSSTLYLLISFFLSWNTPKILQFSRAFLSFKISFISLFQYPFLMMSFSADLCDRTNDKKWIIK